MSILNFFKKSPMQEEIAEFSHYFMYYVLEWLVGDYNAGKISESEFMNPYKYEKASDIDETLWAGVHVSEMPSSYSGIKLYRYNGWQNPENIGDGINAIVVAETSTHTARVFTLVYYKWNPYKWSVQCYNGEYNFQTFIDIDEKRQFEYCVKRELELECKYLNGALPNSNAISNQLGLKQIHINKSTAPNWRKCLKEQKEANYVAGCLKVRLACKLPQNLIYRTSVDIDGLFYIRSVGNRILVICRRGFNDTITIEKLKWLFNLPQTQELCQEKGVKTFIFTDETTNNTLMDIAEFNS